MRILYHHRTQAEDGQAVHIRSLIQAFRAEGHQVLEEAMVPRTGDDAPLQPVKPGAEARPGLLKRAVWFTLDHTPRVTRELAEYAYTVPATFGLVRSGREFRPDFLYERYAFGNAAGVQAARRLGKPLILEVNSPMVLELSRTRGLSLRKLATRVEEHVFRGADRVCVVTSVLGHMLVEMGVEPERLFVTPNGVDLARYDKPDRVAARADLGLAHVRGPVLGFVGYYRDWHRLDLVIDGLRDPSLAHAHLVLVGTGPVEAELRAQAEGLGLSERVHFAGTRPHGRIPALLPAFDVGLVPAINPYASPLKLHEYMAAGVACVAPDQPNLHEVLTPEHDALLVTPGDGDALLAACARLVNDEDLRARLGRAGRETVERLDLTWRGNARRVIAAYQELDL